jgi:acetyl esterase/lipase
MKPLLTAAAVVTTAAGYGLLRRHRRVATAAPELRNPQLYLPLSVRSDRALRVSRKLMAARPPGPIADGVGVRAEVVARSDGRPDVPLMVFEPDDRRRPSGALLWIHGGGLVMGTAATGQELCSRFAAELGIVVVAVDYRLAPEDPFPAALDDCFDALSWIADRAADLGVDPDRIAVGGDSAGGGLAACLTQLALDRGGPAICFQLLQYPMLDDRTPHDDSDALVWSAASNRYAWSAYLGDRAGRSEPPPYAAAARRADLTGLPPAWIGIGDVDLFHDEAISYAERLVAAGVDVDLHVEPGMYHAAEQFVPDAESMRDFRSRMVVALGGGVATTAHA